MASPIMVGASPGALVSIPTPHDVTWGSSDVSSSDAGRTNDANATMHVNRITTKRKIGLAWKNLDGPATRAVLQAFKPEYVWVRYHDPEDDAYEVRQFYSGDKSAPVRQIMLGGIVYSSVSFNIVEV